MAAGQKRKRESDEQDDNHIRAFQRLPIELNTLIGCFLDTPQDVWSYMRVCKDTYFAAKDPTVCIALAKRQFDDMSKQTAAEKRQEYIHRHKNLQLGRLQRGLRSSQMNDVQILIDLIAETYAGAKPDEYGKLVSKNLIQLRHFVRRSDFITSVTYSLWAGNSAANPINILGEILPSLYLMFLHWTLDPNSRHPAYGFKFSQKIAYSHPMYMPLYDDSKLIGFSAGINLKYLMHIAGFFRYHINTPNEATLHSLFCELEENQKPSAWNRPLRDDKMHVQPLGRYWMGCHAYLPDKDVKTLRRLDFEHQGRDGVFPDEMDCEDGFERYDLDFSKLGNSGEGTHPWPPCYERLLLAMPSISLTSVAETHKKSHIQRQTALSQDPVRPSRNFRGFRPQQESPPPSPGSTSPFGIDVHPAILFSWRQPRIPVEPDTPDSPFGLPDPRLYWDYLPFKGESTHGQVHTQIKGIMHHLPNQALIPGWRRFSMIKQTSYIVPREADSESETEKDTPTSSTFPNGHNQHPQMLNDTVHSATPIIDRHTWCYEGVVLPGGKLILGRWWSANDQIQAGFDDMDNAANEVKVHDLHHVGGRDPHIVTDREARTMLCSGPFMMWNVEEL